MERIAKLHVAAARVRDAYKDFVDAMLAAQQEGLQVVIPVGDRPIYPLTLQCVHPRDIEISLPIE